MLLRKSVVCQTILSTLVILGCSKDPKKLVESGKNFLAESKPNEAVIQLRNAIQMNSQLPEAHYNLALAYLALGAVGDATQELEKTVTLQPGNVPAQLKHGNLLLLDRKFDEARAAAELILKQEPANIRAHILLGSSYAGILNLNESIEELRRVFEIQPKLLPAYLDLSAAPNFKRQPESAEAAFKKAMSLET